MRWPARARRLALVLLPLSLLAGCGGRAAQPVLAVGASTNPDSLVLASVYAGALRGTGAAARITATNDPVAMLDSGAVDVLPGFTGRLLAMFAPDTTVRSDRQVYRALAGALPEGIAAGDYATAAEDKPALAVTKPTATAWGSTDLSVLSRHCDGLEVGAVAGVAVPQAVGRCELSPSREFADEATLFAALRARQITVAWTSTAAPDVGDDLVLLTDGVPALVRAENVVPLYRRNGLSERQLLAVNQVAGALDTAALIEMRRRVADGADPQVVADDWLSEHPLWR